MKKSLKGLMAILFVLLFSCQLFAADGVITFVKGKVEVKRGNSWIALNVGDSVKQSEMINTGFQSEAKIKLMDSILYLGPVTRVTLDTLASSNDRDKVNVYLSTGSVRSKVNRTETKRVSYTVRTPIAVASVRGTDWSIDCLNNVNCYEGSVAVIPISQLLDMMNEAKDDGDGNDDEDDSEKTDDAELSDKENTEESKNSDSVEGDNEPATDETDKGEPKKESESKKESEVQKDSPKDNFSSGKNNTLDLTSKESLEAFENTLEVPTTGVVLGPDMSVQVKNKTSMAAPTHKVEQKRDDVLSGVTTESTKSENTDTSTNIVKPTTGSVNVNLILPQFGNLDVSVEIQDSNTVTK